jgi:hypothetical protein
LRNPWVSQFVKRLYELCSATFTTISETISRPRFTLDTLARRMKHAARMGLELRDVDRRAARTVEGA